MPPKASRRLRPPPNSQPPYPLTRTLAHAPPHAQKVAVPPPEPTEFDALTLPQLKAAVLKLREESAALSAERARAAADRDANE